MCIRVYVRTDAQMEYWQHILDRRPETPEQFMAAIYEYKPDLCERDVLRWQRACRDWTTHVFEFVWFNLKVRNGDARWQPHIQALWPHIQATLDAEQLEQLFKKIHMT